MFVSAAKTVIVFDIFSIPVFWEHAGNKQIILIHLLDCNSYRSKSKYLNGIKNVVLNMQVQ